MAKQNRYRLRDSDRSGFTFREIELVKDKANLVGPGEFDAPPPSNQSTGGEGDMDRSGVRPNWNTTTAVEVRPTQILDSLNGSTIGIIFPIIPDSQGKSDTNNAWVYIAGINASVNLNSNPQITSGYQNSIITVQCVSNRVILENGNGLSLRTPVFNMSSGSIITLFYSATNNLWYETSRSSIDGGVI